MSDPINIDGSSIAAVLKIEAEDGTVHDYPFKTRSFNKRRLEASAAHEKKLRELQADTEQAADPVAYQLAVASTLAAICDERVVSTNGPVTVTSLWDDGLVGLESVVELFTKVQQAVANPPA
jgi:hypothetical protein